MIAIHESDAKYLLKSVKISVPEGETARNADEALAVYARLNSERVVVKAQIHAGGRGQAGGIQIVKDKSELTEAVKDLIGRRLVTYQTDAKGQPVDQVYIEVPSNIDKEYYLSAILNREKHCITFLICPTVLFFKSNKSVLLFIVFVIDFSLNILVLFSSSP